MPKYPSYFRADEEANPQKVNSPSPNEWFGHDKTKFRTSPALSEESDDTNGYDGWRGSFHGRPKDPMGNDLLNDHSQYESLKFKDEGNDIRSLIYFLEQVAEIFEARGHIDLAAECEELCEQFLEEDDA